MSWRRHKVRWGFLPAAIIFTASIWIRMGPVIAILGLVAGILLAWYAEWKAEQRRSNGL